MSTSSFKLKTTGSSVRISGSAPPVAGQTLVATSPTVAAWGNPAEVALTSSALLTNNSGGAAADGTIGVVTAPSTITDSSTGAASTTLAAVTNPDLSAWNGAVDPTATQATAIGAAITSLKNGLASLAARQAEDRTAIIALTDAVTELATRVNSLITDLTT